MNQKEYAVVGKPVPKSDAIIKAMGSERYCEDMTLPRMLYGKILRSPHPHARILHINTSKAQRLMGVMSVITGKDTAGVKYNAVEDPHIMDELPLAVDKVRYIGDELAAVAAIDEDIAEEALDLIHIDYDVLPAVFDPEEAMKPEAPKIHDVERNIAAQRFLEIADVDKGFQESDYIKEDRFITQSVTHCFLENHAALAVYHPLGSLTLWTPTNIIYSLIHCLAKTLDMPEGKIRVIRTTVGGSFGGKGEMLSHHFCAALLSKKAGRPVKLTYTREETFCASRFRHPMIIDIKTGVKRNGALMAQECRFIIDNGAYNSLGPAVLFECSLKLGIPYLVPNMRVDGRLIYTNKPVGGAQRGFGTLQLRFASDSQLDMIARELGIDPMELKLRNAVGPGTILPNKFRINSCGLRQCIESVAKMVHWNEKQAREGKGIACSSFISGIRIHPYKCSSASIELHDDGTVSLLIGASDVGQGSDTTLSQICAEELGVSPEDIIITTDDIKVAPIDIGSFSGRVTLQAGNAIKKAAKDAKRKLFEVIARKLEAEAEDLEARNDRIYVKGSPNKGIPFSEAVAAYFFEKGESIRGEGYYRPDTMMVDPRMGLGNISPAYSFGAQVAEVEVDRETGRVKVNRITAAKDCGFAINPLVVEGEMQGSIYMALGQALSEELVRDKGQTLNPSFSEYKMLTVLDVPMIKPIIVETIEPEGPFGAKEAGQGIMVGTIPAIANAIWDAIGVRIKDLPIIPEKVLEALEENR